MTEAYMTGIAVFAALFFFDFIFEGLIMRIGPSSVSWGIILLGAIWTIGGAILMVWYD